MVHFAGVNVEDGNSQNWMIKTLSEKFGKREWETL